MSVPEMEGFDEAFPELFSRAYSAAFRVLRSRATAEDIASEACYRTALRWRRVAGHATAWTVRVATNLALDEARKLHRRSGRPATTEPGHDPEHASDHERLDVVRAIRGLSRRQRQVVLLTHYGGLTQAEAATELNISLGSVKQHSRRASASLRQALGPLYVTAPHDPLAKGDRP